MNKVKTFIQSLLRPSLPASTRNRLLDLALLLRERRISKKQAAEVLEEIVFRGGEPA